jgi:hypothetical protein
MKDVRKIVLGTKDVFPQENKDIFLNVELSTSSDELAKEIIDNNFNLTEQYNTEREQSLKFCIYGTLSSIYSDTENVEIEIKTNHDDFMSVPRIQSGANRNIIHKIKTVSLSKNNNLSKNIFKKNKSSFYFIFELSPFFNNQGETKSLILSINDKKKKIFAEIEVPFLFYDLDGNKIPYGTDTIDVDLDGNEQTIENDYPFLYDTHWIKQELNLERPRFISFRRSIEENINNITVEESDGNVSFVVGLDFPSSYGKEIVEVYVEEDETIENPNKDYIFEPQIISWNVGEQFKTITLEIVDDLFVEETESLIFGLRNLEFCEKSDINNNFLVNIEDSDKPIIGGFLNSIQSITEEAKIITIFLELERAMNVPNQTVDVVFDNNLSTAILGKDLENTGTQENPEFRKKISFTQGSSIARFDIQIFDDFEYEFEKTAIFYLENPSQNFQIDETKNTFTLNVKDSMVPKYSTYIIDNNPSRGQGVFRIDSTAISSIPINFSISPTPTISQSSYYLTTNFRYTIKIINKGVDIIYENNLVGFNGVVLESDFTNGYLPFSVNLPSNDNLDEISRQYQNTKYEIIFSEIQRTPDAGLNIPNSFVDDVILELQSLPSSSIINENRYYLTTTISNAFSRVEFDNQLSSYVSRDVLSNNLLSFKFNGIVLFNRKYVELQNYESNAVFSFFSSSNNTTKILESKFEPELINYTYSDPNNILNPTLPPVEPI